MNSGAIFFFGLLSIIGALGLLVCAALWFCGTLDRIERERERAELDSMPKDLTSCPQCHELHDRSSFFCSFECEREFFKMPYGMKELFGNDAVSPSPRPSPQGEGETRAASVQGNTPGLLPQREPLHPLPAGEGRGEGEHTPLPHGGEIQSRASMPSPGDPSPASSPATTVGNSPDCGSTGTFKGVWLRSDAEKGRNP